MSIEPIMPAVFIVTCVLMAGCAAVMFVMRPDARSTA